MIHVNHIFTGLVDHIVIVLGQPPS